MDVVSLVVTPPGPQRTTIETRQVRPLCVHLRHAHRAIITVERQVFVVLVVQRSHAVDAQHRAVVQDVHVLTQLQLRVLLAFVAQSVFRLGTLQLKTLLRTAVDRGPDAATQVTGELQSLGRERQHQACARSCKFAINCCFQEPPHYFYCAHPVKSARKNPHAVLCALFEERVF
ncbi:hypothetical protein D3C80_1417000 [compost metagenome]